ncbi:flagellar motor protein MotB [Streptomyces sp. L7]|uniref:flagellar motor protein MotB n=1 Tax=Streptomyces sp. L7 TaxID=3423954 RepID=UPI003D98E3C0
MVTVLMCTFIVLFSMSSIDAHKFNELKNSLQTGFGEVVSQKVDTAKGVIVAAKDAAPTPVPSSASTTPRCRRSRRPSWRSPTSARSRRRSTPG